MSIYPGYDVVLEPFKTLPLRGAEKWMHVIPLYYFLQLDVNLQ